MTETKTAPGNPGATLDATRALMWSLYGVIEDAAATQERLAALSPDLSAEQRAQIAFGVAVGCRLDDFGALAGLDGSATLADLARAFPAIVERLAVDYVAPLTALATQAEAVAQHLQAAAKPEA